MRNPEIYTTKELQNWSFTEQSKSGNYILSRPLPFYGIRLFHNLKIAWKVFIGRYDALDWKEDK
jgi:hypothetical protein